MANNFWKKTCDFFRRAFEAIKKNSLDGLKWAGVDGLLNMESAALAVLFLGVFLPPFWSAGIAALLAAAKSFVDEKKGHSGEVHDIVCAGVGVVCGFILLIALI